MYSLPKIYPITDVRLAAVSHAEQVARLCDGGATLIQLREKHLSPREFYREAEAALRIAREYGARLIVNDRADIALAIGADGVHLGQDDVEPEAARRLLGPDAIVGLSTHTIDQARRAVKSAANYLAIGPIFSTSTKENPDAVVGLEVLARVREITGEVPLVAIGGITAANARSVLDAGADCVAVIGALLSHGANQISRQTRELLALLDETA